MIDDDSGLGGFQTAAYQAARAKEAKLRQTKKGRIELQVRHIESLERQLALAKEQLAKMRKE